MIKALFGTGHAYRVESVCEGQQRPEKLIFIDETWAATNMGRKNGRAPKVNGFAPPFRMATGLC